MEKIGIIIQARTGSTRLPKKMTLPFYKEETILSILIDSLKKLKLPIVLATSSNNNDSILIDLAKAKKINFYTGSENNVLSRFVETAEKHAFKTIVRVCGDNPFLDIDLLTKLIEQYSNQDYLSYSVNEKPTILTHSGFFAEITSLKTLKSVAGLTNEKLYLEHVTNYIYWNQNIFNIELLPLQEKFNQSIRLTIDTIEDFNRAKQIYAHFIDSSKTINAQNIIEYCIKDSLLLKAMEKTIKEHSK